MNQGKSANPSVPGARSGLNVDDILFTLFRHKWIVLTSVVLSVVGAVLARVVKPPLYVSRAKLMVHYVVDSRGPSATDPEAQNVKPVDVGAQSIISSEIEILTSLDVATQVVAKVGAQKILAKKGGGDNPMAAAGVVCGGIDAGPPRGSIITVAFKHPDAAVAQPVLDALIHTYMQKHLEVRQGVGELEGYYLKQKEDLKTQLAQTEEELRLLKAKAKVLFLDDTKHSYHSQITKLQEELLDARRQLAERQAVLGNLGSELQARGATNDFDNSVPPEKLSDYGDISSELEALKRNERELLRVYKEAYPLVQTVRGQIAKLSKDKADLERAFPTLASLGINSAHGETNSLGGGVASQLTEIKQLQARVNTLGILLSNTQAEAWQVMELEPKLLALERSRGEQEKAYESVVASMEQIKKGGAMVAGNVINMSIVQNPTPPGLDYKKLMKFIGVIVAGCLGMGVGLAFLIDMFLDRSVKRISEVERLMQMPVFLTIPDTGWGGWLRLPWQRRNKGKPDAASAAGGKNGYPATNQTQMALAPWDPKHHLQSYAEGLRERIRTYFEVNKLDAKKPKLVAVTGCGKGVGVSTLASGLAAELSKTGDGNVLLVDMNGSEGAAHSFHRGAPGCGVNQILEPGTRADGQVQENLYVASLDGGDSAELAMVLPKRFNHLVPKLKASDYDYIIFDMAPVSPTSPTPRLASHMDITLLILESEKTGQQAAARASALMRESRANVAAVLNKYREYAPSAFAPEV